MIKPRRIGHATFETPDLQKMIDYYTQVMGLVLAEREKAIRAADDIARNELGDMYELAKMADTVTVACLMEGVASY